MKVTVSESDCRHKALVAHDGTAAWCCEAGHPDAESAARHAWTLTRAIARRESKAA